MESSENSFENDYRTYLDMKSRYANAKTMDERKAIRREYNYWKNEMEIIKGREYVELHGIYIEEREKGNDYIDFSNLHPFVDPKRLVSLMARFGVERFTLSSASNVVEAVWDILEASCVLEGMIEIKATKARSGSLEEYEKKHAFLFLIG